ncbi:MAG TPA: transglycosylase domain-containing protein [Gaiellaceae bacterium]|nr:transglycosylase domain-containing protein [Gaiellaceae bacterium]
MSPPPSRRTPLDPETLRPRGRHQRALRRRRRKRGAVMALVVVALLATAAGIGGGAAVIAYGSSCDLDSLRSVNIGTNSFVYAADGSLLGSIPAERNREPVGPADMSIWVRKATIAIEDRRFFAHDGVDVEGIARAAVKNLEAGEIVEGGSTITQQLVRNLYISREQTVQRKVKEACLATKLDRARTKHWILTTYLNQSFYGNRAYGIEAAAQTYFSKSAADLTLSESALLVGLPQAPSLHDPFTAPARALARRQEVLRAMLDTRVISLERFEKASASKLVLRRGQLYESIREPYFFGYVRDRLIEEYGAQQVRSGGLKVYTTIIPRYQRLAESAIRDTLDEPDDPAAALISISPRTGAIRAMAAVVPNRPKNQFNLLSQARRQPGSTFKTFVLAAAVEQGVNPDSTYYVSAPFTARLHPAGNCDDGSWWCVKTYASDYYGWSSIRSATLRSDNTVYAQMTLDLTPEKVAEVARRMGVQSQLDVQGAYVPSIGLGSIAVSPLDIASSYATLAAEGVYAEPMAIRRVVLPNGKVDTKAGWGKPKRKRAISEGVAAIVTRILEQNIQSGTGTRAAFGRPAAGKTGTAELNVDAWFAGYTPELATAVWMGYTKAEIPLDSVHGIAVTGGSFPAEMWRLFMEPALDGREPVAFGEPRAWPEWKPFERGEYALDYDPTYTPTETTEETPTTPADPAERESGR